MILFLSLYPLGLIATFIHLWRVPRHQRTKFRIIEIVLLYQLVFSVGLTSLVAFFGLTFLDEYIAAYTEWPPCPFVQQLANVNLGYALLGLLCFWVRGPFWTATVLGFSIWIFSDGIQHLYHYFAYGNDSDGNIGVPLYTDLIIPPLLLILNFLYIHYSKTRPGDQQ